MNGGSQGVVDCQKERHARMTQAVAEYLHHMSVSAIAYSHGV